MNRAAVFKDKLVKDILKTTVWSTIGKAIGFVVPFFIASWFGAGDQMDTFFLAYSIILFVSTIFSFTITKVLVPFIAETRSENKDVGAFIGGLITFSTFIIIPFSLLLALTAAPVVSLITPFTKENIHLISLLILEMAPLVLLLVYSSILDGALHAYKKFTLPSLSLGIRALINIGVIFLFKTSAGIHAIIAGYIAGEIIRIVILLFTVHYHALFIIKLPPGYNKRLTGFLRKASLQILGMTMVSLNGFIDKTMASWINEGSLSVLYYGERIYMVPANLVITGFTIALLSHWSEQYYEKRKEKFFHDVNKALKIAASVTLPLTLLLILLAYPLVHLIYGTSAFSREQLVTISHVLAGYAIGLTPHLLTQILIMAHIVIKNTFTFLICGILMNICNILCNLLLMQPLKEAGLALSTSLVCVLSFFFLLITFKKARLKIAGKSI